jgi:hypothetical protein
VQHQGTQLLLLLLLLLLRLTRYVQQPFSRVTRVGAEQKHAGHVMSRGAATLLRVIKGSGSRPVGGICA